MGKLLNWTIKMTIPEIINKHELELFVETGTGDGESLSYASKFNFKRLYSTEIDIDTFLLYSAKFVIDPRFSVFSLSSENFLKIILPYIKKSATLFWLDAHFPGEDVSRDEDINIKLPLETELKIISCLKDISKDVFLIDDLRIYEDGPFTNGVWEGREKYGGKGIDFVYKYLGDTHVITKHYEDEGYIYCYPKGKNAWTTTDYNKI